MIRIYGIASCDTCRKARQWLTSAGIEHAWIDLRTDGITRERLEQWREVLGDAALINKRSKTWRDFDTKQRQATEADPLPVLVDHPTLIKRPILETPTTTLAGFSAARYEAALAGAD
ncbi:Putative glutaredoxin family protein [Salinisphaera shabanensis E1L3A]|jgi:Spx/MgsR family transcriptional regulator|uniref:Glutaredoxin family protein n=1 Tax=Salinisphaera shabanensis E1L3A TaxID=1033802 RepID=U2G0W0_9GAMM|nr:Spx/MgsR family RNA polymerase-binding regulatory protein [Salinisphaera shabanensis]ERJ19913.1 Putative glutaredoxin family protein [Salinisphaera shabanensis E1L3A]